MLLVISWRPFLDSHKGFRESDDQTYLIVILYADFYFLMIKALKKGIGHSLAF